MEFKIFKKFKKEKETMIKIELLHAVFSPAEY